MTAKYSLESHVHSLSRAACVRTWENAEHLARLAHVSMVSDSPTEARNVVDSARGTVIGERADDCLGDLKLVNGQLVFSCERMEDCGAKKSTDVDIYPHE